MKKRVLFVAIATLALAMTACSEKENFANTGNEATESYALVKSTADLIGTEWTYSIDTVYAEYDGDTIAVPLDMQFGLSFDSTYAHLSFPDNLTVLNYVAANGGYTLQEVQEMQYAYNYDAATHTGTLTADTYDDNGNPDTYQINFTYDIASDAIIVELQVAYEDTPNNINTCYLIFHRDI